MKKKRLYRQAASLSLSMVLIGGIILPTTAILLFSPPKTVSAAVLSAEILSNLQTTNNSGTTPSARWGNG